MNSKHVWHQRSIGQTALIHELAQFDQSIIDAAINQYRHLSAFVRVRGAHFEHKF